MLQRKENDTIVREEDEERNFIGDERSQDIKVEML